MQLIRRHLLPLSSASKNAIWCFCGRGMNHVNSVSHIGSSLLIALMLLAPALLGQQPTPESSSTPQASSAPISAPAKKEQTVAPESLMPWEFRPYKVHCWMGIDPSLAWDAEHEALVVQKIQRAIEDKFGPAVEATAQRVPQEWEGELLFSDRSFELSNLLGRELVIATTKKTKEGKESRTVAAALSRFQEVSINASKYTSFKSHLEANSQVEGFNDFAQKLKAFDGPISDENGDDPVAVALLKGEISIGVISRAQIAAHPKELNVLPIIYPWHLQTELSNFDKILVINLKRADYGVLVEVREIDCLFRSVGKLVRQSTISEQAIPTDVAQLAAEVFVPYVRMESSDDKVTKVRLRAGELIPTTAKEENPCFIGKGDVLRPIMRRDNLRGEPQMIQYVPWTYLVAFTEEKSNLDCAIFSGVRSQLLGRPNRRLYRMATLLSHPSTPQI